MYYVHKATGGSATGISPHVNRSAWKAASTSEGKSFSCKRSASNTSTEVDGADVAPKGDTGLAVEPKADVVVESCPNADGAVADPEGAVAVPKVEGVVVDAVEPGWVDAGAALTVAEGWLKAEGCAVWPKVDGWDVWPNADG